MQLKLLLLLWDVFETLIVIIVLSFAVGKLKINEEFRKHANVKDPEEVSKLLKMAQEANQVLLTQVVQAKEVRPNVYSK